MMLHQDGSRHEWLAGQAPLDLIVTLDDATGTIYSAFLVEEEGTASTFRALKAVFAEHGLPGALYTDRGSHYFHTPEAGGKVDKGRRTQVGRALHQLGIEHIAAYSPEARGRSERTFGTLQDRLVKELALAGIAEIEAANRFIKECYLPEHNRRFAVPPELEDSAFVPLGPARPDRRHPLLCTTERSRRPRQHRPLRQPGHAAPRRTRQTPLRQSPRPRARVPRRHARRLPRTQMPRPLPRRRASPSKHQPARPREPLRRDRPGPWTSGQPLRA